LIRPGGVCATTSRTTSSSRHGAGVLKPRSSRYRVCAATSVWSCTAVIGRLSTNQSKMWRLCGVGSQMTCLPRLGHTCTKAEAVIGHSRADSLARHVREVLPDVPSEVMMDPRIQVRRIQEQGVDQLQKVAPLGDLLLGLEHELGEVPQ